MHAPALPRLPPAALRLALAWLLPRSAAPLPACRAGLFDCSLPLPDLAHWRRPADLLQAGAWCPAWAAPMLQPRAVAAPAPRASPRAAALQAAAAAAAVLAPGSFTASHGPDALRAVRAVLALVALAGAAAGLAAWRASSYL